MSKMRIQEIAQAAGGKLVGTSTNKPIQGISIDSRTIKRNEAFIAIKGKNFDGHDFIKEAVDKGASVVVSQFKSPHISPKTPTIIVSDTLKALGDIARYHRRKFDIPIIGITGSNGKTTVKEIIAHVLSARFNVLKNKGTENNFIGVPTSLLKLTQNHQAAVIEMGTNHIGEIDRLGYILRPTIGLITNIGPSHLEFFGDLNTVLKAKSELLNHILKKLVVLNGDDRLLSRLRNKLKSITFGIGENCDFRATDIVENERALEFNLNGKDRFRLNLVGRHNIYNGLASVSIATILGMDTKTIQERLTSFKTVPMRMQIVSSNGIDIIDDTYNSNPISSKYAIMFLSNFRTRGKRIFVTGDMLELGRRARYFHRQIGKMVACSLIDSLVTVGELSKETYSAAQRSGMNSKVIWNCPSADEATSVLARIAKNGDVVLVKGSRAMAMERVVEKLKIKNQNAKI